MAYYERMYSNTSINTFQFLEMLYKQVEPSVEVLHIIKIENMCVSSSPKPLIM